MSGLLRFSATFPCPICSGHQKLPRHQEVRCSGFLSEDGHYAYCSRVLIPGRPERNGCSSHWLKGPCDCGLDHSTARPHHELNPLASRPWQPGMAPAFDTAHDCLRASAEYLHGRLSTFWIYQYQNGLDDAAVGRIETARGKEYRPAHRNPDGSWALGDPPNPWPLYNIMSVENADLVLVVEGEKCADIATALGFAATTSAHGAHAVKKTDWTPLAGKRVIVIPDQDTDGQKYALAVGYRLRNLGCEVTILDLPDLHDGDDLEQWVQCCPEDWNDDQKHEALQALIDAARTCATENRTPVAAPPATGGNGQPRVDDETPINRTELGNARRFVLQFGDRVRYCFTWNCWLIWDGTRWKKDETREIERLAKQTVRSLGGEAKAIDDDEERKAMLKWALTSESRRSLEALLKHAMSEPGVPVTSADLDTDPWLFNVPNGTINLKTGALNPHRRSDLITKLSPVEFHRDRPCARWDRFEDEVFAGTGDDHALSNYMRRVIGYSLTADQTYHELYILYGEGSNGKNIYLDMVRHVMGDYAHVADSKLLMATKTESIPVGEADLEGMRFVMASESDAGDRLGEATIKRLTGDQKRRARRLYQNPFDVERTYKIFLPTNHRPEIRGTDFAVWRRIRNIPFNVTFVHEGQEIKPPLICREDPDLLTTLKTEAEGILAAFVRGCLDWQKNGMKPPEAVLMATKQYREEQDTLRAFLADACIDDPSLRVRAKELYDAYTKWAGNSASNLTLTAFGKMLEKRGYEKKESHGIWYLGLQLRHKNDN